MEEEEEGTRRERRGGEEETRNRGRATHHECPHGCCCSLIWGLMLRGCLVAPFYTGQLGSPTRCLDPSPMRCDGTIANLSPSLSFSFSRVLPLLALLSGTQICPCTFVEIHPFDPDRNRLRPLVTHMRHVDSITNEREKWTVRHLISRRS